MFPDDSLQTRRPVKRCVKIAVVFQCFKATARIGVEIWPTFSQKSWSRARYVSWIECVPHGISVSSLITDVRLMAH